MESSASFPVEFCRTIRTRWRRSAYQRVLPGENPKPRQTAHKVIKLNGAGDGAAKGSSSKGRWRVRKVLKVKHLAAALSPLRLLARLRDAYMDAMVGLSRRNVGMLTGSSSAEAFSRNASARKTSGRSASRRQKDFERKLVLEICRSLSVSGGVE